MDARTDCCIAGGGPAGMMLGLLLARAGVHVTVLEKHADFLRDFRGDTVHPSTLEIMNELGLLDEFLARPHQKIHQLQGRIEDATVTVADFSHLPVRCPFIVLMPQWHFLDFLAEHARRFPNFHLELEAEVVDLVESGGAISGVRVKTREGERELRAKLVVGADGRSSIVRARAGLTVEDRSAPIDVLWMRVSRRSDDPGEAFGVIREGQMMVLLDRGDYWQCAFIIRKGGDEALRAEGLEKFRGRLARIVPFLGDRVSELKDWDQVKRLTVKVDRLTEWARPGLLCIGDAAHAMSPIGGVGINLAIQDAVAAANALAEPLRHGEVSIDVLRSVQRRREFPTNATQRVQLLIQDRVIGRVLADQSPRGLSRFARIFFGLSLVRRMPARILGLGFRPEHVRSPVAARDI